MVSAQAAERRRRLAEQIADAEAPFWAHVRDALAQRHP